MQSPHRLHLSSLYRRNDTRVVVQSRVTKAEMTRHIRTLLPSLLLLIVHPKETRIPKLSAYRLEETDEEHIVN